MSIYRTITENAFVGRSFYILLLKKKIIKLELTDNGIKFLSNDTSKDFFVLPLILEQKLLTLKIKI